MTKTRLLEIVRPSMMSLIEMDLDNGDLVEQYGSIEKYCEELLHASREEIEEIIGMNIEDLIIGGINMDYEYTPLEMAKKLMWFIYDFSDSEEDIREEIPYVAELFDKLQKSEEFEVLAHHLDIMFMDSAFDKMEN